MIVAIRKSYYANKGRVSCLRVIADKRQLPKIESCFRWLETARNLFR
jgi:hypothetical protein